MIEIERVLLIADLSGYTALAEAHGALRASDIVLRLARLAEESLAPTVRLVERVGDEVFYAAADADAVIRTALRLREAVEREPEFPTVRAGIHSGPVVERDGRFFGPALNLTARIASEARGGQILCTASVAESARRLGGIEVRKMGERRLRNVAAPVALYELAPRDEAADAVAIDPVCRMQVLREQAIASINYQGTRYCFCSLACARAFAEAPHLYAREGAELLLDSRKGAT
jgi:class 3 adenylate cyclase/YHS domain-containing protein